MHWNPLHLNQPNNPCNAEPALTLDGLGRFLCGKIVKWGERMKATDLSYLEFWGTSDTMGVPRVYCDCEVCEEARGGGLNQRLRSSVRLSLQGCNVLIDCGPDWKTQMEAAGLRQLEDVLITHAHIDHIGGLPEWYDALRWTGAVGRLYAPEEVLETIRRQYPWLSSKMRMQAVDQGLLLEGWRFTPFKVCHGKNGFAYAYHFSDGRQSWVYCSDAINLTEEQKNWMRGVDGLILGTSFVKEQAEMDTRSVYDMEEALQLIHELKPARTWFTHMSHDVDERKLQLPGGVTIARSLMRLELNSVGGE